MKIIIDKACKAIWHRDCVNNKFKSGVIQELNHDGDKTLVKCLHCGSHGFIPVGATFGVEIQIEDTEGK